MINCFTPTANGVQIARSTISTGRKGKITPTGVFTILQRKIDHGIEHLQRCQDALHAATNLDGNRHACRRTTRLSSLRRLHSPALRILQIDSIKR